MLGKLAKRLRLLGFDVFYSNRLDDNSLINVALEQNRMILTRDRGLAVRPLASNNIFILSNDIEEQLLQVLSSVHPDESIHPLTRCSVCNQLLTEVFHEEIKDNVPRYVYDTHSTFLHCSSCGRIYWRGTHMQGLERADS